MGGEGSLDLTKSNQKVSFLLCVSLESLVTATGRASLEMISQLGRRGL